jgi:hypothetical protein
MRSANLTGMIHPITGLLMEPIGFLRDGTAVWPVVGGAPDPEDPDDKDFTGEDDDADEDDDDDEDEDDKPSKPKKKVVKKAKKSDDDEDDDDDEDEDRKPTRPERQAARYRVALRETRKELDAVKAQLQAIADKDKKPEELTERETKEAKEKADKAAKKAQALSLENAFLKVNQIDWVDPEDALYLADREDLLEDVVDEDGTVDKRALRAALRDLAKRKPHLVKPKVSDRDDEDDDEDDDEPRSTRSARTGNGTRKGSKSNANSREALASKFPVLRRN